MKQNNVTYMHNSEEMLKAFESVDTANNVEDMSVLGTSIHIKLKCGCVHIEHFNVPPHALHYQRHYIELCDKHAMKF